MDNRIPNHPNDPDDCNNPGNVTAVEVAEEIMKDVTSEYDLNDFLTIDEQAELLRELIGIYASYKFHPALTSLENRSELLSAIASEIEASLKGAAVNRGYAS